MFRVVLNHGELVTEPVFVLIIDTVFDPKLGTYMFPLAPSYAKAAGLDPTVIGVPTIAFVVPLITETVLLPLFVT